MQTKDLMLSLDNFISALSYTYHVDHRELLEATADMCQREANRLAAIDPDRNK